MSTQPNILWICTDQQRYDTIFALGNKYAQTPNLDQLVNDGTTFTNAFCQSPVCAPSRASFLTVDTHVPQDVGKMDSLYRKVKF